MKWSVDNKRETSKRNLARQTGFTLIELLLVLVILATLAAIVTPKFAKRGQQAKITAAKTQISQLEVALDAFEIDVGRYPTTVEGLQAQKFPAFSLQYHPEAAPGPRDAVAAFARFRALVG